MSKVKTPKTQTQKSYRNWSIVKWLLYGGTYATPLIPAGIMVGVNWEEWFTPQESVSLGLGFASLLLTIVITIVGIGKRDKILRDSFSPLYYFAMILALWAIVLMFLASIAHELGTMLLYTCFGLVGGATCDQFRKTKVDENVNMYKALINEFELDDKQVARRRKRERARALAEEESKRRAVE